MFFRKYMHVERFGNIPVVGIEMGKCYVFPKLDGTNAQLWYRNGLVEGGSRNRTLTVDNDNAGFLNSILTHNDLLHRWHRFFLAHPNIRVYGEWLVPHSLKTYRDDAWRKFYVFDVYNDDTKQFINYDEYKPWLDGEGLEYIAPLAIIKNGSYDNFVHTLDQNNFYIKDGEGTGEGIVIKNYDFVNDYGDIIWAKIVKAEFKELHHKEMGAPEREGKMLEEEICEKFCTATLIVKTHAKILVEHDGWLSQYIPELLGRVYYDVVTEEGWNFVRLHKDPTINFKTLKSFITAKVKTTLPEIF